MKQLAAFIDKEFMELTRTGKMMILVILFIFFGIMNPVIAKLMPWLMKLMSGELAKAGLIITEIDVDALVSWAQFYKNIPLALVIFLLMFSSTLTAEYLKGTLINMITKGLDRWKVIAAKGIMMTVCWTAGYWGSYMITYSYNAYFWDNRIARHLLYAAVCFYLTGLWMISLIILMSTFFRTNSAVLIMSGGGFLVIYLLGLLPEIKQYLPIQLFNAYPLLEGTGEPSGFTAAIVITVLLCFLNFAAAVICFNKRNLC